MTPAEKVIKAFGGVRPTARVLGLEPSTVSYWVNRKKKKAKGSIPVWHHKNILKVANQLKIPLTKDDLYS
jgi:hypothetical protein